MPIRVMPRRPDLASPTGAKPCRPRLPLPAMPLRAIGCHTVHLRATPCRPRLEPPSHLSPGPSMPRQTCRAPRCRANTHHSETLRTAPALPVPAVQDLTATSRYHAGRTGPRRTRPSSSPEITLHASRARPCTTTSDRAGPSPTMPASPCRAGQILAQTRPAPAMPGRAVLTEPSRSPVHRTVPAIPRRAAPRPQVTEKRPACRTKSYHARSALPGSTQPSLPRPPLTTTRDTGPCLDCRTTKCPAKTREPRALTSLDEPARPTVPRRDLPDRT